MKHYKNILVITLLIISSLLAVGCSGSSQTIEKTAEVQSTIAPKQSDEIPLLTEQDILDAQAVVEIYFMARNQKDADKILSFHHPSRFSIEEINSGKIILFEQEEITLLKIHEYDWEFQNSFTPAARQTFAENNIIVLKGTVEYCIHTTML